MGRRPIYLLPLCLATSSVTATGTVEWAAALDGKWIQASNWSPAIVPNNGQPTPPSAYDVLIDQTGAPYIVTLDGTVGVNSIVLNSTAAALSHTSGILTIQGLLDVKSGSYLLRGGTLAGATLTGAGSISLDGTLNGVTIANSVSVTNGAHVTVNGGLTLSGGQISLGGSNYSSVLAFPQTQTLGGTGAIVFGGTLSGPLPLNTISVPSGTVLTIDSGITINTGTGGGIIGQEAGGPNGQTLNKGLIWSQTDGQSIRLIGSWKNQGILRVSAGRLELYGTYSLSDMGTIEHLGGDVVLGGTFNNTGTTLALTPQTGSWKLEQCSVNGGTVSNSGGARLIAGSASSLHNVQIDGDLQVVDGSASIDGTTTFTGGTVSIDVNKQFTSLRFYGDHTVNSNMEFTFNGPKDTAGIDVDSGTLTLGANVVVHSGISGGFVGFLGSTGGTAALISQGAISARTAGKTITVGGTTFSNQGLLEAVNGGKLIANSLIGDLGNISVGAGSRLEVYGEQKVGFTNVRSLGATAGAYLALGGKWKNTGDITVNSSTLELSGGGTNLANISASNNSIVILGGSTAIGTPSPSLGNISLTNSELQIKGSYTTPQMAGITFNNSTVTLFSLLNGSGQTQTLSQVTGDWKLAGGTIEGPVNSADGTGLIAIGAKPSILHFMTLTAPVTIQPEATVQANSLRGQATVNNAGIFDLTTGSIFTLAGNWSNTGKIIVDASVLNLAGPGAGQFGQITTTNGGTINLTGPFTTAQFRALPPTGSPTISITGTINNIGDTFDLSASFSAFALVGGTISGGSIISTSGKTLSVSGTSTGTFDGVTLAVPVDILGPAKSINGLTLNNSIVTLKSSTAILTFLGTQTVGGTGELRMDSPTSRIAGSNGTLTIGPNITIRLLHGAGTLGSSLVPLINQGTIRSQTAGGSIAINSTAFTNSGLVEAVSGGSIAISKPIDGMGRISVGAQSTLTFSGGRQQSLDIAGQVILRTKSAGGTTIAVDNLTIAGAPAAWTAKLDLADNALALNYTGPSPEAIVRDQIRTARAGGAWTGNGITTSRATGSTTLGYGQAADLLNLSGDQTAQWLGQSVDATTLLVRYTLVGDANLNGAVDFPDLVKVAQNYGLAAGATWPTGDFNYDNNTDFADLVAIAQNYGTALPAAPIPGATADFNQDLAAAFATVPKPSMPMLGLLTLGTLTCRTRRKSVKVLL